MCNHLITIKNPKNGEFLQVPCGHCIECLNELRTEWATRMAIEFRSNKTRPAVMVTLTYNDENLPVDEFNKEGVVYSQPSVKKEHIQSFIRHLRTYIKREIKKGTWKGYTGSIKYFITSEYGPQGGRPHYHGIIYGLTKKDLPLIEKIWNKGFVHVGDVNDASIMYVAKYCYKPVEEQLYPDRKGYFDNEKWMDEQGIRRKPFRLMSTSLGKAYFEDEAYLKFHFKNMLEHNYIRVGKQKKKMPRYFKKKIYTAQNYQKYGKKKDLVKIINNNRKNDLKYGKYGLHDYSDIVANIGLSQFYRHLADDVKNYSLSEDYGERYIESAQQRENLLIQNHVKWMRRKQRYHRQ